ncbi:MAG TPA: DUF2062 domain-containing protein [Opitutaceae bacterium]
MNAGAPRRSFWQRRVREPLLALLSQGLTPDKLALTLGIGSVCSLFPFLGFTSLLNLLVGLWLKLNQPLLQTLNQLLGPLQLVLIVVYVRAGEWIWRAEESRFTVTAMVRTFREASALEFLSRFGWAGIHAATAWALTAPAVLAAGYFLSRPLLRRLASKTRHEA